MLPNPPASHDAVRQRAWDLLWSRLLAEPAVPPPANPDDTPNDNHPDDGVEPTAA